MDTRDDPRWGLGEGITVHCQDGIVTVMHDCSHGVFVSEAAEKLSEACGSCKAPLQAAFAALLVKLNALAAL